MTKPKSGDHRKKTLIALGFGHFIDQGEAQAMSVLSPIIQSVWGLSFSQLGLMTTLRNLLQTISAPFWGYAADKYSRRNVLIFGTGIWGLWTLAIGLAPNFSAMIWLRAISGLGLGCLMPATFSLLADHYPQSKRGTALGIIGLIGMFGVVIGVLVLGFVATPDLWRWGFIGLGLSSVVTGIVIWWLVDEPPRGAAEPEIADIITHENAAKFQINIRDAISTLKIPTIWAAILQGISGTMPWVVMGFYFINWMVKELGYTASIQFDNPRGSAPLIFASIVIGSAFSKYIGGRIGDWAERLNPKYGRTIIGQISVFSGVPLSYMIFTQGKNMPFWSLFSLAFFTALMIGWAGPGSKEPMMQAVIPPELRSSGYSVVSVIEGGLSAFAGIIAGYLADSIGFTKAMLWTIPFPWILCGLFFSLFYFTYPKDAEKVRVLMAERREILLKNNSQ